MFTPGGYKKKYFIIRFHPSYFVIRSYNYVIPLYSNTEDNEETF